MINLSFFLIWQKYKKMAEDIKAIKYQQTPGPITKIRLNNKRSIFNVDSFGFCVIQECITKGEYINKAHIKNKNKIFLMYFLKQMLFSQDLLRPLWKKKPEAIKKKGTTK